MFGVIAWDGRQPGEHLAWGGPGDGVHLHCGAVKTGGHDFLGTDYGLIGPARHGDQASAQAAVDAYLALYRAVPAPRWDSIEAFYAADDRRRLSGEADYGVHWRQDPRQPWPTWRVSYIRDTGEVYAAAPGGPVELLGTVPPDDQPHYYATLDAILEGWPDAHRQGLDWVRGRLAAAGVT